MSYHQYHGGTTEKILKTGDWLSDSEGDEKYQWINESQNK